MIDKSYYVYVVRNGEEVVYVGSGKGTRYLHANSGKSHNEGLNSLHQQGVFLDVSLAQENLTKEGSRSVEQNLIDWYDPPFNVAIAANKQTRDKYARLKSYEDLCVSLEPLESNLVLAREMFHLAMLTNNVNLLASSFAISRSGANGEIWFTSTQRYSFLTTYMPKTYGYSFILEPVDTVFMERIYNTTVINICAAIGYVAGISAHAVNAIQRRLNACLRAIENINTNKDQLELF